MGRKPGVVISEPADNEHVTEADDGRAAQRDGLVLEEAGVSSKGSKQHLTGIGIFDTIAATGWRA